MPLSILSVSAPSTDYILLILHLPSLSCFCQSLSPPCLSVYLPSLPLSVCHLLSVDCLLSFLSILFSLPLSASIYLSVFYPSCLPPFFPLSVIYLSTCLFPSCLSSRSLRQAVSPSTLFICLFSLRLRPGAQHDSGAAILKALSHCLLRRRLSHCPCSPCTPPPAASPPTPSTALSHSPAPRIEPGDGWGWDGEGWL